MIRRHTLPTYAAAAFCAAFAAGRAGAQSSTPAPGVNSGKEYVLKNTSTFNPPPTDSRNPFWPIGWVPAAPVAVGPAAAAKLELKAEMFVVTSISVDSNPYAVINGQIKGVGEKMLAPGAAPGTQEFVTVKKITDGVVVMEYKGQQLELYPSIPGAPKKK